MNFRTAVIADFYKSSGDEEGEAGSMTYTHAAIWPYLYGKRVGWEMVDGSLAVKPVPIENFTYNGKAVPAGFFDLPSAENVSAVLFSNAGTIAKFDRMGVAAGFEAPGGFDAVDARDGLEVPRWVCMNPNRRRR